MTNQVMKEIVTVEQATAAIRTLALTMPPVGAVLGTLIGALGRRTGRGALIGLLCGLIGPAVWVLWRMYNGIMGRYGLDSVAGLAINLALFALIGVGVGAAIGLGARRRTAAPAEERAPTAR